MRPSGFSLSSILTSVAGICILRACYGTLLCTRIWAAKRGRVFVMRKRRKTLLERRDALKDKLAKVGRQLKVEDEKDKKLERRQDNRRKIYIGALAQNHMDKNPDTEFTRIMTRLIDEYVIRNEDRIELFGLDPLSDEEIKIRKARHVHERRNRKTGS